MFNKKTKYYKIYKQVESLLIAFIVAMILRQFVVASYKIPTGSMEKTLLVGDFLLGTKFNWGAPIPFVHNKFPAFSKIKRNDIVIFKSPVPPYYEYIKRCVATSGDTVRYKNKKLYINSDYKILPPEGEHKDARNIAFRDNFGPYIVPSKGDYFYCDSVNLRGFRFFKNLYFQEYPYNNLTTKREFIIKGKSSSYYIFKKSDKIVELDKFSLDTIDWYLGDELIGEIKEDVNSDSVYIKSTLYDNGKKIDKFLVQSDCYFMMGDNRDLSSDSRFWGFVSHRSVLARPLILYFSLSSEKNKNFFSRIRFNRIGRLVN